MPPPNTQVMGESIPDNTAIQETSGFLVSLKLDPYPPSVANSNGFEVSLTDSNGQAVSDASIRLDLTMPGMMMPPNQFSLVPVGAGKYQASGPFTMRGPWRIEVVISIGETSQSVFFDVWL
jgi:nitrogen fixation protein FixH